MSVRRMEGSWISWPRRYSRAFHSSNWHSKCNLINVERFNDCSCNSIFKNNFRDIVHIIMILIYHTFAIWYNPKIVSLTHGCLPVHLKNVWSSKDNRYALTKLLHNKQNFLEYFSYINTENNFIPFFSIKMYILWIMFQFVDTNFYIHTYNVICTYMASLFSAWSSILAPWSEYKWSSNSSSFWNLRSMEQPNLQKYCVSTVDLFDR